LKPNPQGMDVNVNGYLKALPKLSTDSHSRKDFAVLGGVLVRGMLL
jgi:hypothetical protein